MLDLTNPFPGLRCFLSEEDYLFFGRHEQIDDLLRRLRTNRLVAVVGTSGSGKSSLVRAGLLPAVLGGGMAQAGSAWDIAVMRPGGSPLAHLARALCEAGLYDAEAEDALCHLHATLSRSRNGLLEAVRQSQVSKGTVPAKLLLVVDQFEELFRFHRASATSQEEAIGFVNLLLHATQAAEQTVYVVLTMRSDFLGECSQFLGLAEAVNDGEFLIPRMTRDQIQEAIEGPLRVRGAAIAPRLLFRLLNDVEDSQDQLPVLQHALMRTWDSWQRSGGFTPVADAPGSPLDLEHYEATGGMKEALSRHADEVFAALPSEVHRTAAARVFKALTERGPDGRGIRRPTRLGQLAAIAAVNGALVQEVIEAYRVPGVTFLMPPVSSVLSDDTVIDISHESLMRVWRRLREWAEEEAQSARIYRRLHETAGLHAEGRAGLYRDPDLQIAWSWRKTSEPNPAWAEQYGGGFAEARAFLEESRAGAERAAQEQEAARRQELTRARQLAEAQARVARLFKRFAAGLVVGLCLAVALTIWALLLRQEAIGQEEEANRQGAEANKQRLIAEDEEKKTKVLELVELILTVDTPHVAAYIAELTKHRQLSDPMLREFYDEAPPKSPRKLHASLALLPVDPGQVDYLHGRLLDADLQELPVIVGALAAHKDRLKDRLWAVVEKPAKGKESQRLRAAAALARYEPDSKKWGSTSQVEAVVFLSTLREKQVRVLQNFFRKDGFVNCSGLFPIVVDGTRCPNSLFTHPAAQTFASVSYDLNRPYTQFQARVGIPAVAPNQTDPQAPLIFEIIGDGKSLWKSAPLARRGAVQDCAVSLEGVKQLELRVHNPGSSSWAHPVWLEPRLIADQETHVTAGLVNDLLAVPAADLTAWKDALRPARLNLLAPLWATYRSIHRSEQERSLARDILADYADDQPQALAELLMGADEKQFARCFAKLKARGDQGLPALLGELDRTLPPDATQEAREQLAKRQANAAVALLRLNRPEKVWPLLHHRPDPRARSYLIHRLSPLGADAVALGAQLERERDPGVRRALLLSLGEFGEKVTAKERQAYLPKLQKIYRTAADPGVHAAAEWLLRQWNEEAWLKKTNLAWAEDKQQQGKRLEEAMVALAKEPYHSPLTTHHSPRWYVNGQGQTLVVIPGPVEFWMGSPPTEEGREGIVGALPEVRHWRRIGRSFAIASKEVTVEQFLRFRKDHPLSRQYLPSDDCPANMVSWSDAAAYCNWLSEQEGIPKDQWCYEPNAQGQYAEGMRLAPNYLQRTGYRLPTEAEWEYACRAGTVTRYSFGESEELLPKYAWYLKNWQNQLRPVASLKPNDLGLFDMHGNDWEWCQEEYKPYLPGEEGKPTEDNEDRAVINYHGAWRILRGGVFSSMGPERSAARSGNLPGNRIWWNGLRPARTLPFRSFDRHAAAREAVLAAAGQGKNKPPSGEAGRAKLRQQALDWLRGELTDWSKVQPPRAYLARNLWQWQEDIALSGIRDQAALAKLPQEQRSTFTQFWGDVAQATEPVNNTERLELARFAVRIAAGLTRDEPPLSAAAKARFGQQALDWFKVALAAGAERAEKARIIAVAAPLPGLLEKLAESASNDGEFQAEVAQHFAAQGQARLANAARAKARTWFEEKLAKEPENAAWAEELAQLLWNKHENEDPGRWAILKPAQAKSQLGATLSILSDGSILASGTNRQRDRYRVVLTVSKDIDLAAVRLEALTHPSLPGNGPGRYPGRDGGQYAGTFAQESCKVTATSPNRKDRITLEFDNAWADHQDPTYRVNKNGYWNIAADGRGQNCTAIWSLSKPVPLVAGTTLTFEMEFGFFTLAAENLGHFRLSVGDPVTLDRTQKAVTARKVTDPWSKLATAYAVNGQSGEALRYFSIALQRAAGNEARKPILELAAQFDDVLSALVQRQPGDAQLQLVLARKLAERGKQRLAESQPAKAQADLEKARAIFARLLAKYPRTQWKVLTPTTLTSRSGATLTLQGDGSILVSGNNAGGDVYTLSAAVDLDRIAAVRLEALPDPSLPNKGPGRHSTGNFHLGAFRLFRPMSDGQSGRTPLPVEDVWAGFDYKAPDADIAGTIDERLNKFWHVWGRLGQAHQAVFRIKDTAAAGRGRPFVIELHHRNFGEGCNLGRFRLSVTRDTGALAAQRLRKGLEFKDGEIVDLCIALAKAHALQGHTKQAVASFTEALDSAVNRAAQAQIVTEAARFKGVLEALARHAAGNGPFQAELARHFAERGDARLRETARAKARALFEEKLAKDPANAALAADLADVLLLGGRASWTILKPKQMKSQGGATLTLLDDGSILAGGKNPDRDVYSFFARTDLKQITAIRLEALPDASLPRGGPGRSDWGNFNLGGLRVFSAGRRVSLTNIFALHDEAGELRNVISGRAHETRGWSNYPRDGQPNTATIATRLERAPEDDLSIDLYFSFDPQWPHHGLGRFRLSISGDPKAFQHESDRVTVLRLTDPWERLAAAYHVIGDQPALAKLLKHHPAAAAGIGDVYASQQDWTRALAEYNKVITSGSKDARFFAARAEAHEKLEKWELAAADWGNADRYASDKKVRYGSPPFSALERRAIIHERLQQYEKVVLDCNALLKPERLGDNPWIFRLRGAAYDGMRQWEKARADHDQAIKLSIPEERGSFHSFRACHFAAQGQWKQAAEDMKQAYRTPADYSNGTWPRSEWWAVRDAALIFAVAGDVENYSKAAAACYRKQNAQAQSAEDSKWIVLTMLLFPEMITRENRARLLELAGKTDDYWRPRLTAAIDFRGGNDKLAAQLWGANSGGPQFLFLAAMVQQKLGKSDRARQLLEEGNAWLRQERAKDPKAGVPRSQGWQDWATVATLQYEAFDLILGPRARPKELAERAIGEAQFQAALARHFAERGNKPLADAARTKARALFEKQLANEPENTALAAELAGLLLGTLDPAEPEWIVLKPAKTETESGAKLTPADDGSFLIEAASNTQQQSVRFHPGPQPVRAVRIETSPHTARPAKGAPFFNEHQIVASRMASQAEGLRGRFVRLDLPGDNRQFPRHLDDKDKKTINLAEMQVFHGDQNIALRKKAYQSSTVYAPENAVDGNTVGSDSGNPYAHTASEDNPWWEVDLGSEQPIDRIVIWNRIEFGLFVRMNHFRIRVLDPSRKVVFEQVVDKAPNPRTEIVPQAVLAKTKSRAKGQNEPLIVRLPPSSQSDAPSRYRVSGATRLADLGLHLTDPWIKLGAAYAYVGRHAKAVEYYRKGLQANPKLGDDRQAQHRYHAARAAARAAVGQGKDMPPPSLAAKARLRDQALDWLRAELNAWSKLLESGLPQDRPAIVQTLHEWQKDTTLAGIRDQAAMDKLPADEKKACTQLWADVAALLKKAGARSK
jgi:formylglycine-generating enzyme required for sulfatase activity